MAGTLYVVATPIGNLRDITLRALDVLREADLVVAEDTRHSRKLLAAHGIRARLSSLHAHSSERKVEWVVALLAEGQNVAYVTDAGAPTVSDPGTELVDLARRQGLHVQVVPGPSALTAALAVSGLPVGDFHFLGFLPRAARRRREALAAAGSGGAALVLFESPRRLAGLLADLEAVLPDRRVAVCRELTKVHEEVLRGLPGELARAMTEPPRGEVTVVVSGGPPTPEPTEEVDLVEAARAAIAEGLGTREAAARLAERHGVPRRLAYQSVLAARGGRQEEGS